MAKIIMDWEQAPRTGRTLHYFRTPKGGNITFVDIHNFLVEKFGGGVYLVVVNANDGELLDKISVVDAYDADDIVDLL